MPGIKVCSTLVMLSKVKVVPIQVTKTHERNGDTKPLIYRRVRKIAKGDY